MTPTQLRAFACVARWGSVKAAADELGVSESAVSMHVGQLRRELDDKLFTRTASGLAFTPGGLRLASRAVDILGLQDRTVREVSQAASGRRLLRMAASSMFAEHAAPGLIALFAGRADDLDVELSVRRSAQLPALLVARTVDVAIGPAPGRLPAGLVSTPLLGYEVVAVCDPQHRMAEGPVTSRQVREETWLLGPSAADDGSVVPDMLRALGIPESQQRIFQSDAASLEEAKRGTGIALAVRFSVAADLAARRLAAVEGPGLQARGQWAALALPEHSQPSAAAELMRFVTTPRATQAMVHGGGVTAGRFKPSVHVTLWS
ncbi:MAG TPA: LysR family transcriptional regulator [Nocardioidaceae bacterium]|nr:LysR family transcriptional regulator [Nocardioidaceae bacterium]